MELILTRGGALCMLLELGWTNSLAFRGEGWGEEEVSFKMLLRRIVANWAFPGPVFRNLGKMSARDDIGNVVSI